jgi:hypothetical protein
MNYSRQNPSDRYKYLIEQYQAMHDGPPTLTKGGKIKYVFDGVSLSPHVQAISGIIAKTKSKTILDYGSGKGMQYADGKVRKAWNVDSITCYDPAYKPLNILPTGKFDGVVSTDVLEHCPIEDVDWILEEIIRYAAKFVFMNVSCKEAKKLLPDGTNAHCTVQSPEWWAKRIKVANTKNVDLILYATTDKGDELIIGKPYHK